MHFVGYQVDLMGITFESLFFPVFFQFFNIWNWWVLRHILLLYISL